MSAQAQQISGLVFDEYLEPFPGAIVKTSEGNSVTTNYDGEFVVKVKNFPVTINISLVGFQSEVITVTDTSQEINVILKETFVLDQVVISASRTPERVMESPVTIERIDGKYIKKTPSPNFYQSLGNLKGIDVLDNNYLTKTVVSNRGFASTANNRFVQLIDGVDGAVPVFDYALGNIFGLNELDVKNVEILPGAASALYGANAFNGIMLMTSKNPFDDAGISIYTKSGVNTQEGRGTYAFYDIGARLAFKFNDWVAGKVNIVYNNGEDWVADDRSDSNGSGATSHQGNTNYNGVNVYGDDFGLNLVDLALSVDQATQDPSSPLFGQSINALQNLRLNGGTSVVNQRISRTGFLERELIDYRIKNTTFEGALHFRPWKNKDTEIIFASKFSLGNNISQASNRYAQNNSYMEQFRLEFKGKNYFLRGYYNENDAGKTVDSRLAGVFVNNAWKSNRDYFTEYGVAYFTLLNQGISSDQAHNTARLIADTGKPEAGSNEFNRYLNLARATDIAQNGARLDENSGFYHVDANYNLADHFDFADIQVGGSFRSFALDSNGQVYTDDDGVLRYRQYGVYTQVQKKFNDDRIKFTGTVRFDKSRNFDGNFSLRATVSYSVGEKRDHNFRLLFQTGFRNPTSQDQYLGLTLGNVVLLGSVAENLSREVIVRGYVSIAGQQAVLSGESAFNNSYTAESVEAFQSDFRTNAINGVTDPTTIFQSNPNLSRQSTAELVKPETVKSFELGYRGAVDIGSLFEFDLVGFFNIHEDFITSTEVVVPFYGSVDNPASGSAQAIFLNDFQRYIINTNSKSEIQAYGFSAGFNTKVLGNFDLGASYAFSDFTFDNVDDFTFKPGFNTPKHSVKLQFGHDRLFKNFGFAVNTRWQDEFLYQSRFLDRIVEDRFVVDAQMNYTIPSTKLVIKVGGTNITGKEYISVPEAGTIGSQYYVSWTINN